MSYLRQSIEYKQLFELSESENKELRKALEFYASQWNHDVQLEDVGITSMQKDRGKIACQALKK